MIVATPDGKRIEFPEDMTADQVQGAMRKMYSYVDTSPRATAERRADAEQKIGEQYEKANRKEGSLTSFVKALGRGAESGTLGIAQRLTPEKYFPETKENMRDIAKQLSMEGKGSGISGAVGETILDPRYAAMLAAPATGLAGLAARAGTGALAGALEPTKSKEEEALSPSLNRAFGGGLANAALPPIMKTIGKAVNPILGGTANKIATSDVVKNYIKPIGDDVYKAAKNVGLTDLGRKTEDIRRNISSGIDDIVGKIAPSSGRKRSEVGYDVIRSLNGAYTERLGKAKDLYDRAKAAGEGKTTSVEGLKNDLDALINDLAGKEYKTKAEERALGKLAEYAKKWRGTEVNTPASTIVDASGNPLRVATTSIVGGADKVPVNELVELRQVLNSNFKSSEFMSRGDVPLSRFNNRVKDALTHAGSIYGDFGKALGEANTYWEKDVAQTFRDNSVLEHVWTPEDYYGSDPHATEQRAHDLVGKVKSSAHLSALRDALPDKDYSSFAKERLAYTMSEAKNRANGMYSIGDVSKILYSDPKVNPDAEFVHNLLHDTGGTDTVNDLRTVVSDMYDKGLRAGDVVPTPESSSKIADAGIRMAAHNWGTGASEAFRSLVGQTPEQQFSKYLQPGYTFPSRSLGDLAGRTLVNQYNQADK